MSVAGGACATQVSTGCEGLNHIAAGCFMLACCSLANKRLAALFDGDQSEPNTPESRQCSNHILDTHRVNDATYWLRR
jgi:hypothetical protein